MSFLWHENLLCVESSSMYSDASKFVRSSTSATKSPFQIPPAYKAYPTKMRGRTILPYWWIFSQNEFPAHKMLLQNAVHYEVLNVWEITVTFHGMRPPIFIQTRVYKYRGACVLPFLRSVSVRWNVDVQMPVEIFTSFAKFD